MENFKMGSSTNYCGHNLSQTNFYQNQARPISAYSCNLGGGWGANSIYEYRAFWQPVLRWHREFYYITVCCVIWSTEPRVFCNIGYPSETHIKPKSRKNRFPVTKFLIDESFSTNRFEILQNFETLGQSKRMLWTNEILRNLSLRSV